MLRLHSAPRHAADSQVNPITLTASVCQCLMCLNAMAPAASPHLADGSLTWWRSSGRCGSRATTRDRKRGLSSGPHALSKSALFTQTCDLPLFLCPWPKSLFTLVLTPTSAQKRGGTKETLLLLLALANRGDA